MQNGESVIKKNEYQMDTTPSCVHFNKKGTIQVGQKPYLTLSKERIKAFRENDPSLINAFEEFKRRMGTDETYECKNMGRSFTPEELSAEVLKKLKGYIQDEDVNAIVITVPAKFQGYQIDATKKAAELAGFQHCILLQEPIAASMAYGLEADSIDGLWVVFDFGGGTFDAALMKAEEGIMRVVDTEGDSHLGGKNIDYAIVDDIIIPYLEKEYSIENILSDEDRKTLLRNALKRFAEEAKNTLSSKNKADIVPEEPIGEDNEGNEIELDLSVTKEQYDAVVKPIFQRAIDKTQKLISNNNLSGSDLKTVLMVGGPTLSITLRDMVKEQIKSDVNVSIDPMTAVARGAALFASTKDIPEGIRKIDKTKIQLKVVYPETTVETEENVGIRINRDKTEGDIPENLFVEVTRQDKAWSSGKIEIKDDAEIVPISLIAGRPNGFRLLVTDNKGTVYPAEPDSFSIIQGFKAAKATLQYDLCIEAYDLSEGKQHLVGFKGLEKNQSLSAKGKAALRTQKDIRPGDDKDIIRIPIYWGERGTKAIHNDWREEVVITGEMLPAFLPKGSEVELSIEVDESQGIKVIASFPYLDDESVDVTLDGNQRATIKKESLRRELEKASRSLENMEDEFPDLDLAKVEKIHNDLNELDLSLAKGGSDPDTRDMVLDIMREVSIEIDKLQDAAEVPKIMQELTDALEHLKDNDERFGDEKTSRMVKQLSEQVKIVNQEQDARMAKGLTKQIHSFAFAIVDKADIGPALEISFIKGFDDEFDMHEWKDRARARQLIKEAKSIISANRATKSNLKPIVGELFSMLPKPDQKIIKPDDDLLMK
ncbi:MAG: Hsp70 family protein [Planctomycetes bacterium]|nr:Hsp70 family protein [Planctomycetota bacterium]